MNSFQRSALFVTTAILCVATPAYAQTKAFDVPAQSLDRAVSALGRQGDLQIVAVKKLTRGKISRAVKGAMTADQALGVMLVGSGLQARRIGANSFTVVADPNVGSADRGETSAGDAGSDERAEDIVVTGTNISGQAPIGASTVTIDRREIERAGFTSTEQTIRSLPQVTGIGPTDSRVNNTTAGANQNAIRNYGRGVAANLRGLGSDSTLVLIDGHRVAATGQGTFVDISAIPLAIVDRIEILTDGASAIYGSDAVAGVINVVTRKDFRGAESSVDFTLGHGFSRFRSSQLLGTTWSGGSAYLAYQYSFNGRIAGSDRPFVTNDSRPVGGRSFLTNTGYPGTITAAGITYAIPTGQDGVGLTAASLRAGTANTYDAWRYVNIIGETRNHSVAGHIGHSFGDLELSADLQLAWRNAPSAETPYLSTLSVPRTNPFFVSPITNASTVSVGYNFYNDLGSIQSLGVTQTSGVTTSAKYKISDSWSIRANGLWGRDNVTYSTSNSVNSYYLNVALSSTNPQTAFNPFSGGVPNNRSVLQAIMGFTEDRYRSDVLSGFVALDGSLFSLPGGVVKVAVGAEVRNEQYQSEGEAFNTTAQLVTRPNIDLRRTLLAEFAELSLPIFGEQNSVWGMRTLKLSAAVRHENYSDFGSTTNPKFGAEWSPTKGLTAFGSFGTSFKAPSFVLLDDVSSRFVQLLNVADPKSSTGTSLVLVRQGGNPLLGPETSRSWNYGIELKPEFLPGLRVKLSGFDFRYVDRVSSVNLSTALQLEQLYAAFIIRNPTAAQVNTLQADRGFIGSPVDPATVKAIIDSRNNNIGILAVSGFDLAADYRTNIGRVGLNGSVAWTHTPTYSMAAAEGATPVNLSNTLNYVLRDRMRLSVGATLGSASIAAFYNHANSYANTTSVLLPTISSWTTVDLSASYTIPAGNGGISGLRMSFSGVNIFNRTPPIADTNAGYDVVNANAVGQYFTFGLSKQW